MDRSVLIALISLPFTLLIAFALAWAGSQGSAAAFGWPLFALGVGASMLIQWLAFIPAWLLRTEKFYDLVGSLSFLMITLLALAWSPDPDSRTFLLAGLVSIWAVRLGSFLFYRILHAGSDARFDEIKHSFPRFLLAWTLQGLWVAFSMAAALAAITAIRRVDFGIWAVAGLLIWLAGFGIEVVADYQKRQFRKQSENKDRFIQSGLWSLSRHPNYFGEILLWTGIAVMAFPVLQGWQYLTLLSPVFVTVLLTQVSGIPPLEKRADEKWGGREAYERYKEQTPVLVPKWPW